MEGRYEYDIDSNYSREAARKFLAALATKESARRRLQDDPTAELAKIGLVFPRELLPEEIRLPPPREIAHLLYTGDSVAPDGSPFGWLVLFVVFGAMPVTAGGRAAADGAG